MMKALAASMIVTGLASGVGAVAEGPAKNAALLVFGLGLLSSTGICVADLALEWLRPARRR